MRAKPVTRARCLSALLVAALSVSSLAFGAEVDDGSKSAARSLAGQGKDAFDRKDYEQARDLFHRAYTLVPAPTIALYEGRALSKLGRLVEAEEAYMRAVHTHIDADSSEQFKQAIADAETDLGALQPRIPRLTIALTGPGAHDPELAVTLDGAPVKSAVIGVETPINPGEHVLRASPPGAAPAQTTFSIAEKETKTVQLEVQAGVLQTPAGPPPQRVEAALARPTPAPHSARSWQKPTAFAAAGVGVAGLATGIVAGLIAGSRYSKAENQCPGHVCAPGSSGADTVDSFRTLRTVSTVGYIVGGVGLAAGATLFFTAPTSPPPAAASVKVWIAGPAVSVAGSF